MKSALWLSLAALAVLTAGCAPKSVSQAPANTPVAAPAQTATVKVTAYINVSSGCQEPTITLLQELARQYGSQVSLEIVDYGDQGQGLQRWQKSGYHCLALDVNGQAVQVWEENGKQKIVNFMWPVGYSWTQEDLKAMIQAWVEGRAHGASEQEVKLARPPRELKVEINSVKVTQQGKEMGQLIIGDRVAIRFKTAAGKNHPYERARQAADTLLAAIGGPPQPPSYERKQINGKWVVMAYGKILAVVTEADAKADKSTPEALAKSWMVGVRQAMALGARSSDQGCKEEAG